MRELNDLELEQVSAGAEKLPLLIPALINLLPIFFPKKRVEEARAQLAAARGS